MEKVNHKSILLWLSGFIIGIAGYLLNLSWLYLVGALLGVAGILLFHKTSEKKSLWQLLLSLLGMVP